MSNSAGIRQRQHRPKRRHSLQETPEVEDSILLRALVQMLVIVGIVATDVAAGTLFSPWAIPFSIIGATWSWYRRRERNVPVKFVLAIGMIVAMMLFFRKLLGFDTGVNQLNDTRLLLAELLIQLQVLHTFDLPRRKDLGYSMVIGLILLGVAGTVSQTLAFAPLLLLFLAIALPVLILDYRSRLGLLPAAIAPNTPARKHPLASDLSWKRLGIFLLVIVALGLGIFALMPRFPGYQLRTFPVSAPQNLQTRSFNAGNRGVVNPGYVQNGTGEGGQGQGEMDDTFYYGFGSRINQNLRGQLTPKVVMRVRSQAEGFWRVLGFDRYTGQGWEISRNEQTETLRRPNWSYRFFVPFSRGNNRTREVIQSYTVVEDLPNIIPALTFAKELYFPTYEVDFDAEGGLRSPGLLLEGLTYTVISEVPYRDRTLLAKASTEYSELLTKFYLQIPPQIADRVRQQTEEILARSPNPIIAPYEQALYLAQYLKQHYSLPESPFGLPPLQENEDLVEAFLFKHQQGYPDHFSTVLTMMLRSIGVPSRLVVGFAPGEFNPFTGLYVVRNTDAYAMTEVYFPRYGWFTFDPIPGHPLFPPSIEEDQTFSVLRQFWNWVAGWLPTPLRNTLNQFFGAIAGLLMGVIAWLIALFTQGWIGFFTGLIILIGFGFLGWLAWNYLKTWRRRRWLNSLHPMESLYQQMTNHLAMQGFRKHPAQTPLEYANVLRNHYSPQSARTIEEISYAYVNWRYGGRVPNLKPLQLQLRELIKNTQSSEVDRQLIGKLKSLAKRS